MMRIPNPLYFLNPFIGLLNFMSFSGHMEMQSIIRENNQDYVYERYDFSTDIKYFNLWLE